MKYFGYMPNDFLNGEGINVSIWMAGCPHHCEGCHNANMWDYNAGYEMPENIIPRIIEALSANGIDRNLSILGGEPLASYNVSFVTELIKQVKVISPYTKIYLWTGFTFDQIQDLDLINYVDVIIDGPYIQSERDITLPLRGSKNQRILRRGQHF